MRITIGIDGQVKAEAEGFSGGSCLEASKFLDELFGEPEKRDLKQEFYQADEQTNKNNNILGGGWCG
jgi:hypothetical protein